MLKARIVMVATTIMLLAELVPNSQAQEQKAETLRKQDISVEALEGLNYPPIARLGRVSGRVVVRVTLDERGKVLSASALSGHNVLAQAAIANAKEWRFHPSPDKTAEIVYEFRIIDECVQDESATRFHFEVPNSVLITDCAKLVQPSTRK